VKSFLKKPLLPMLILAVLIAAGAFLLLTNGGRDGGSVRTSAEKKGLTVIVDAGHGGADGGAVSITGEKESAVNIDIATRLDHILAFFGTRVVMTRTTEELDYSENATTIRAKKAEDQNRRLQLINTTENAVLLSIHQNTYPDGGPFGAQVLYAPTNGSQEFAVYMQKLLIGALNKQNRRTAAQAPANVLLMNHIKCPAVLVECGFLSNAAEEQLLMSDAYRTKIAAVVAAGYLYNRENLTIVSN
jgi:N-acetylmuramoyl-L-alanine amidase